jgi:hypothetical protein
LIIAAVLMPHPAIALCPVKILCPQRSLRAAWLTKPCSKLGIFNNARIMHRTSLLHAAMYLHV